MDGNLTPTPSNIQFIAQILYKSPRSVRHCPYHVVAEGSYRDNVVLLLVLGTILVDKVDNKRTNIRQIPEGLLQDITILAHVDR